MTTTVVISSALAVVLVSASVRPAITTAQISTKVLSAVNRTSRELQAGLVTENLSPQMNFPELRPTGRKLSSDDDYRTLPSMDTDMIVEASVAATGPKTYPSLMAGGSGFVTRGRHIRNPYGSFGKNDQEMEFEDDQPTDYIFNGGGGSGMPKWNRYNTNHRQLNKYMSTPIEADITVEEDGSAGYGSAFNIGSGGSGGGMGYDYGNYRNPGNGWRDGGGNMGGLYNENIAQASRPLPIIAEIRHPSTSSNNKMSVDMTKIGMLAMVKIAMAKFKALGFIKALLLVVFKLKLLIILVFLKFLMISKFTKLTMLLPALVSFFTMPMFFSRLSRLYALLNDQTSGSAYSNTGDLYPTSNTDLQGLTDASRKRTSQLDPLEVLVPGMTNFGQIIRSEKCLERVSCQLAGAKKPNLALIWLNWVASPLSTYIPNKKLKNFVLTFTEVTNYRLDNLYSNLLPKDWTRWCNDHYTCNKVTHKTL
ncbi:Hypothetical protein CINCED_3A020327 [Cinara cedri]|uniref:Uncharacterized protein n=1 Tax=Cinara cedri TaxID=506608 RepID=A0A5E4MTQ0_9HEMI|nr:Hypothetical protein CINCED_3A020327 [Cinara cedri]